MSYGSTTWQHCLKLGVTGGEADQTDLLFFFFVALFFFFNINYFGCHKSFIHKCRQLGMDDYGSLSLGGRIRLLFGNGQWQQQSKAHRNCPIDKSSISYSHLRAYSANLRNWDSESYEEQGGMQRCVKLYPRTRTKSKHWSRIIRYAWV
jgi:hypothetical protein